MSDESAIGMPPLACVRLHQAIEEHELSKAALERAAGISPGALSRVTSKKAMSGEVTPPEMGSHKFIKLAVLLNRDPVWLMGYSDVLSPLVERYKRDFTNLLDRFSSELMEGAAARCAVQGKRISVQDVLQWWETTGGEVGRGSDIEEYFDVVRMPEATDDYAQPLRVGAKSYAGIFLQSTDPRRLEGEVRSWPENTRRELVQRFRRIQSLECGASFPIDRMTVQVADRPDPISYWCLRLNGKLAGPKSPPAAIVFAFDASEPVGSL